MSSAPRRLVVAMLATTTLLVAGCTGMDRDDDPTASPTPSPTVTEASSTPTPSATPSASASPSASAPESTQAAGIPTREPASTPRPPAGELREVGVEITRYSVQGSTLTAGGVVSGIVEQSGTCRLIVSGGGGTVRATGPAARSAGSMACGEDLSVSLDGIAAPWTLVLAYESDASTGRSEALEVTR